MAAVIKSRWNDYFDVEYVHNGKYINRWLWTPSALDQACEHRLLLTKPASTFCSS